MCGISGIIDKGRKEVSHDLIKKITDLISHRGPDDEGFFIEKNFAFGHRRLSILDLSAEGHQPMHFRDRYTITYNGEVYNYLEIKKELLSYGYAFVSNTDTEVILASFDKWGKDCVRRFNGMWAFAIYDKQEEQIFCSRDRFGIKPFYFTETDNEFVFGSEIKQLLPFQEKRVANKDLLIDYITTGIHDYSNDTFFKNINKLEQSHNLLYDLRNSSYKVERYYSIQSTDKGSKALTDVIAEYEAEITRAVSYRLRSDVKVGTCLSGGLDSSLVATLASKMYHEKSDERFTAIHAKSSEKVSDESEYAKIVRDKCNLELHVTEPSVADFRQVLDEVVYTQEEPFGGPSIFMQYFVMKKAKETGCTVMLDGQGGDETLLGYEKYYPSAYRAMFKKHGLLHTVREIRKSNKNNAKMLWYLIFK